MGSYDGGQKEQPEQSPDVEDPFEVSLRRMSGWGELERLRPDMNRVALLEHWYRCVYLEGDQDAVGMIFSDRLMERGLRPGIQTTLKDISAFAAAINRLVKEPHFRIVKTVEDNDWLCALIEAEAQHPDDDRKIYAMGQLMARFKDDKIIEAYNSFDFIGFFEQLGLLPEGALAIGLDGKRIV